MAGGAFNFLYTARATDLLGAEPHTDDLRTMVDFLEVSHLPGATDLAARTLQVMAFVKRTQEELEAMLADVRDGWEAVELYESGDVSLDGLADRLGTIKRVELQTSVRTPSSARAIATLAARLVKNASYSVDDALEAACACASSTPSAASRETARNILTGRLGAAKGMIDE